MEEPPPQRAMCGGNILQIFTKSSYGICMWEIFSFGKNPYIWLSNREVTEQIPKGVQENKPDNCPDNIFAVVQTCWAIEPSKRPDFIEVCQVEISS